MIESDIIKSDLFFFISAIAVIVLTITIVAFIIYLIQMVRKTERIIDRISSSVNLLSSDFEHLRSSFLAKIAEAALLVEKARRKVRGRTKNKERR